MAKIGVSKPFYAIYSEKNGTLSYSDGGVLGMATEVDVTINTSEDNNLYADNGIAETDRAFTNGSLTIGTDDLSQEVSKAILGVVEKDLPTIAGITPPEGTTYKELVFDNQMTTPYLGVGFIVKGQKNNIPYWRPIVFTKVMFNVPDDAATTQGESIEWQTPSLVGTILRDDSETHVWKRETRFSTEAEATAYIKHVLNITPVSGGGTEESPALRTAAAKSGGSEKV